MNAIELLIKDHESVADLLNKIDKTTEKAVKSREKLFEQLKSELEVHEKKEELYFYPPLKKHKETQDLTFEAIEEHHLVDDLLKKIKEEDYDSKEWSAKFQVLKENIEHHVQEEENELFPKVKKVLSKEELEEIAEKMNQLEPE